MRIGAQKRRRARGQGGYALALMVFMLALVAVAITAVAPNVITNGRREKEEEMIWRGKQYVRGIRLFVRYYQTHGGTTRFPTSMEDLTKNKVGIRFMRQAYKDPVNSVDGSWRMIYVGPNGQLIGSLKNRALGPDGQPVGGASSGSSGGFGSLFGGGQSQTGSNSSFGNSSFGNSSSGNSSFGNSSFGSSSSGSSSFGSSSFGSSSFGNGGNTGAANTQGQTAGQGTAGGLSSDTFSTPQSITNDDGSTDVLGGNIIGVGSKVNKASIIWYDKAKNYRQFEFIWDPSKDPINGGAAAGVIGGVPPAGTTNGQNGIFGNQGGTQGGNSGFGQQPSGSPTGNPNPGSGTNPPPGQTPPGQTPQ